MRIPSILKEWEEINIDIEKLKDYKKRAKEELSLLENEEIVVSKKIQELQYGLESVQLAMTSFEFFIKNIQSRIDEKQLKA